MIEQKNLILGGYTEGELTTYKNIEKNKIMKKIVPSFILLVILASFAYFITSKPPNYKSGVYFKGEILSIKKSNNHSFGIYVIKIDSTNQIEDNVMVDYSNETFPFFRKCKNLGEVYATVSVDDSVGFFISTDSSGTLIIVQRQDLKIVDSVRQWPVVESVNRRFIQENTLLR
jgi:hypothetical protein